MAKYALLVGISEYQDPEISDLPFAARDAEALGESLEKDCGFEDVRVLSTDSDSGEAIGSGAISRELIDLRSQMGEEDTFLFFFAGHGAVHGDTSSVDRGGGADFGEQLVDEPVEVCLDDQPAGGPRPGGVGGHHFNTAVFGEDLNHAIGGGIGVAQVVDERGAAAYFEVVVLSGFGVEAAHFLFEYGHQDALHIFSSLWFVARWVIA